MFSTKIVTLVQKALKLYILYLVFYLEFALSQLQLKFISYHLIFRGGLNSTAQFKNMAASLSMNLVIMPQMWHITILP